MTEIVANAAVDAGSIGAADHDHDEEAQTARITLMCGLGQEWDQMDGRQFDAGVRELFARTNPRRSLITGLAGGTLALVGLRLPLGTAAKGKRKQRKPLKRNEFGCVPVDKPCRGRDNVCCSGICAGKKPKKGEKDESRCVAHDEGGCQKGQRTGFCGGTDVPCTTSLGMTGICETTTGKAGFCAHAGSCHTCRNDEDCQTFMTNPRAACISCAGCMQGAACLAP